MTFKPAQHAADTEPEAKGMFHSLDLFGLKLYQRCPALRHTARVALPDMLANHYVNSRCETSSSRTGHHAKTSRTTSHTQQCTLRYQLSEDLESYLVSHEWAYGFSSLTINLSLLGGAVYRSVCSMPESSTIDVLKFEYSAPTMYFISGKPVS